MYGFPENKRRFAVFIYYPIYSCHKKERSIKMFVRKVVTTVIKNIPHRYNYFYWEKGGIKL